MSDSQVRFGPNVSPGGRNSQQEIRTDAARIHSSNNARIALSGKRGWAVNFKDAGREPLRRRRMVRCGERRRLLRRFSILYFLRSSSRLGWKSGKVRRNRGWRGDEGGSCFRKAVTADLKSGKTGGTAREWSLVFPVVHRRPRTECGKGGALRGKRGLGQNQCGCVGVEVSTGAGLSTACTGRLGFVGNEAARSLSAAGVPLCAAGRILLLKRFIELNFPRMRRCCG